MDIEQLTVAERLDVTGKRWDSLDDAVETVPVPDWHLKELEPRVAVADADPAAAIDLAKARDRFLRPS